MERETIRISSAVLFKRNLLDSTLHISTTIVFLICLSLSRTIFTFLALFSCIYWAVNHQIESYRSFKIVNKCTKKLRANEKLLRAFLSVHIGSRFSISHSIDTFRWANKIIAFFWPYFSHVIHYELNEFLRESGSFAHSDESFKQLTYAILRQLDANILAIEKCQLGAMAPYIKNILVSYEMKNKTLIYDLDLAYEGNMNISFICKYFCCCTSRLGLKDVFMRFKGRVIVGPIKEYIPKVEKIKFTLLELPEFGYRGIAMVELAELKVARRAINKLIKEYLLYPESVSVSLSDLVESLKKRSSPQPQPLRISTECNSSARLNHMPLKTKFMARIVLFACMCSNFCLRCCQEESRKRI